MLVHFLLAAKAVPLLFVCFISILSLTANAQERGPVGLDAMDRMDMLPYLWPGAEAGHVSSRDPDGGNDDRGNYLASSGLTKVLFHEKGAGCIYRIWTTNQQSSTIYTPAAHGDIRIYVDGSLVVNTTLANFFSGNWSVFQYPLAGSWDKSSGGFYSYVPIPYRSECKIEWTAPGTSTPLLYYNISYIKYNSPDGIVSFTGQESSDPLYMAKLEVVKAKWLNCGTDPKTTPVRPPVTGTVSLPKNGGKAVMCEITGPGCISRIRMRPPLNAVQLEWTSTIVNIYFDDHTTPDVKTTYGRFFGGDIARPTPYDDIQGYENFDGNIRGLLFSTDFTSKWQSNFFPMPFAKKVKIELVNTHTFYDARIEYEVYVSDMPDAERLLSSGQIGYFRSTQEVNPVNRTTGKDYNVMDVSGRGKMVALVYTPYGGTNGSKVYLEGDERIHVDNSLTPSVYGTGTEDTFSGGWYFKQGRFSLPSHGYTARMIGQDGRSVYRLFMGDNIPFNSRLKFGFECGKKNGEMDSQESNDLAGAFMYSTVFYYWSPVSSTLALTDTLDVGNTASQTNHNYTITRATTTTPISRTLKYEGDNDNINVSDSGMHHLNGSSQFTISIVPNNYGVKLRRLSYYAVPNQQALVKVNGQTVGTWYDAGSNTILSWRDSDFMIPASFTQGKNSIIVTIESIGEWTEYKYQAYVFVSPGLAPPSPNVSDDGAFYAEGTFLHFSWTKPDEPVWGINGYSYAVGTVPGGTDVRDWTDCGNVLSYTAEGLRLVEGKTYYVSVKARNGAGVWSTPGTTDGISAAVSDLTSIKSLADGATVGLNGYVVTGVFGNCLYMQSMDRSSGIRVESDSTVSEGDTVFVEGKLSTANGERKLTAERVIKL